VTAELNYEIYKCERNAGKIKSVLSSERPCELKSLIVALNIAGIERLGSKKCGCKEEAI